MFGLSAGSFGLSAGSFGLSAGSFGLSASSFLLTLSAQGSRPRVLLFARTPAEGTTDALPRPRKQQSAERSRKRTLASASAAMFNLNWESALRELGLQLGKALHDAAVSFIQIHHNKLNILPSFELLKSGTAIAQISLSLRFSRHCKRG